MFLVVEQPPAYVDETLNNKDNTKTIAVSVAVIVLLIGMVFVVTAMHGWINNWRILKVELS